MSLRQRLTSDSFHPKGSALEALNHALTQQLAERTAQLEAAKAALAQEAASRQQTENAFQHTSIGMALLAPDGSWLRVNPALCEIVGYSEQELRALRFQDITHPDDLDTDLEYVRRLLAGEIQTFQREKRYIHRRGHIVHIALSVSLVRGEQGQPLYFVSQFQDITDRKNAELAVERARRFLDGVLEGIPQPVFVKDSQHHWVLLNTRYCELIQRDRNTLLGKSDPDVYPPEQAAQFWAEDDEALRSDRPLFSEAHITRPDGSTAWLLKSKQRVELADGVYVVGVAIDITSQKQAEMALRESEQRVRAIADNVPALIAYVDAERRYRFVNRTFERWYGVPGDRALGRSVREILGDQGYGMVRQYSDRVLAGERVAFERTLTECDVQRHVETVLVPDFAESGRVAGYYVLMSDITERKQLEDSLRRLNEDLERRVARRTEELSFQRHQAVLQAQQAALARDRAEQAEQQLATKVDELQAAHTAAERSAARLRGVLESAMDAIIAVDESQRIVLFNAAAESMFGCPRAEAIGAPVEQFIPERSRAAHAAHINEFGRVSVRSRRMAADRIVTGLRRTGEEFPIDASISQLTENGRKLYTVILRDVTERVRAQEALERSNLDLQQFAYVASHDLRTPLRAIGGFIELLHKKYAVHLGEDAVELTQRAIAGARRLDRLIEDLLSYSRLGSRGQRFESTDCRVVFDDAVRLLEAAVREAGAEVTADPLPTVLADRAQLVQVFQNLIGNGIKYHGERSPKVHVSAARQDDAWVFSVSDNGIGIDPKHHERIFEIFRRLHTRHKYPGTGIGLAVCRRVVHGHGGTMWVNSEPGAGSTFFFTIPDARQPRS